MESETDLEDSIKNESCTGSIGSQKFRIWMQVGLARQLAPCIKEEEPTGMW